ncbi:MAG TPA: VOC family protein [Lentimicrobium sp.]|nr:VOC family protein [Lentimicrobium sp.]
MASASIYLNFSRETEEAFLFYRDAFGTEFVEPGFYRFGDIPAGDNSPAMDEEVKNLVMHVTLPITGGMQLMGSDVPPEMGFSKQPGNNIYINLMPDSREETRRLFRALAEGGTIEQELREMFWGDYFGSLRDRYGVQWMFNCPAKE